KLVRDKAHIAGQLRLSQNLVAENGPFTLVLQTQHDDLTVSGRKRPVRIDRRVRRAGARRRSSALKSVVQRIAHPLCHRLEERYIDARTASRAAACEER